MRRSIWEVLEIILNAFSDVVSQLSVSNCYVQSIYGATLEAEAWVGCLFKDAHCNSALQIQNILSQDNLSSNYIWRE